MVEMVACGLDYSIKKKLYSQFLRDMTQLADGVRHVERLKLKRLGRTNFIKNKKLLIYKHMKKTKNMT